MTASWDERLASLWAALDTHPDFVADMEKLVAELPSDDPVGPFELASPKEIQVLAVEPHQADGPMPRLEEGSVPMIVLWEGSVG